MGQERTGSRAWSQGSEPGYGLACEAGRCEQVVCTPDYTGFASYELLDSAGNVVLTGRKQAYCMEDTSRFHDGPNIGCEKVYSCDAQGIQPGWTDLYGNALDCQWLDVTDMAPGDYRLRVVVNPGRAFQEVSFDNNTSTVPVTIPAF